MNATLAIAINTAAAEAAIQAIDSIPAQVPSDYQPSGSSWFSDFTECGVGPYLEGIEGLEKDEDGDYPQEAVDLYAAAFNAAAVKAAEDATGRLDLSGWIASTGLIGSQSHRWSWHSTREEAEAQNCDWVKPYKEVCDQRYQGGGLVFYKDELITGV